MIKWPALEPAQLLFCSFDTLQSGVWSQLRLIRHAEKRFHTFAVCIASLNARVYIPHQFLPGMGHENPSYSPGFSLTCNTLTQAFQLYLIHVSVPI